MMMAGSISAQKPSITRPDDFAQSDLRGGRSRFSLRTTHHQATHKPTPSSRPGTMPARNSLEIETPRGHAEDDEADAGRDDRRDDAARGDQARRIGLLVAGGDHHRHQQRRQRRGIGRGRPGERGQDAGRENRDVAEPAATVADERPGRH